MLGDLRVCFVGDSLVAGVGDPEHLGWVGRLCARTARAGTTLTAYNLGVRRQTSADVRGRWFAECAPRLSPAWDCRVVLGFGVNDTMIEDGRRRVPLEESVAQLSAVLGGATAAGWSTMVVGPTPVADQAHTERIRVLDVAFGEVCAERDVSYVPVFDDLRSDDGWTRELARGDGAHPSAAGYAALADLVWPRWSTWTRTTSTRTP